MLYSKRFDIDLDIQSNYSEMLSSTDLATYLDNIAKHDVLPFKKVEMYFSQDRWDFTSFTTLNIDKYHMVIDFNRVEDLYKSELKKYALELILENRLKINTIKKVIYNTELFFMFLYAKKIYTLKDVTYDHIKAYLDERKSVSLYAFERAVRVLRQFYSYYSKNYEDLLSLEVKGLLEDIDRKALSAMKKQNRVKDIPITYFNRLVQSIIAIIDNANEPSHIRAIGCVILILSQTGLRIGEVLALRVGDLAKVETKDGSMAYYINYKTWKREKGNNVYSIVQIFANELTVKAFYALTILHEERRKKYKLDYLYMGSVLVNKGTFPISDVQFISHQKRFYYHLDRYIPTINVDEMSKDNLSTVKYAYTKQGGKYKYVPLTFPMTRQFRVRVCTDLYNKGVPLQYIQRYMGHLSNEMKGYYVRPKEQTQEDLEYSKRTLEKLVTGELNLLGSNAKDLTSRIQEFIDKNNYNVCRDLDDILESLLKNIPIRQKVGGVCIKGSILRDCTIDAKTNEFYCAYGVCPNVFHFFYNADISYRQIRELTESIRINQKNGFNKQAQKEINMRHTIVTKRLRPELVELKKELEKKGKQLLLDEYPELNEVLDNLQFIENEVVEWMKSETE